MKLMKCVALTALMGLMAGCGHGYEGEFQAKTSNEMVNSFMGSAGDQKLEIGSDYIEAQGQRTEFDEIFVRESGDQKYLVFKDGKAEEAWKIVDEDTLIQSNGFMDVTLVRVK